MRGSPGRDELPLIRSVGRRSRRGHSLASILNKIAPDLSRGVRAIFALMDPNTHSGWRELSVDGYPTCAAQIRRGVDVGRFATSGRAEIFALPGLYPQPRPGVAEDFDRLVELLDF